MYLSDERLGNARSGNECDGAEALRLWLSKDQALNL